MNAGFVFSVFVLLTAAAEGQQDKQSWENLATLRTGQKIQVKTRDGGIWKGAYVGFTPGSISLHAKGQDREIPRGDVRVVQRTGGAVRTRHALIGAGIGAGAGAAIVLPNVNQGEIAYPLIAAAPLVMVAGTVVGAVLPAYSTVYEAGP